MKNKKVNSLLIGILIAIILVESISAAEIPVTPENVPFNFVSWFKHTFGIQSFSICGQDRGCDVYPKKTLYFTPSGTNNVLMDIDVDDYCNSGHGLIDLFKNDWAPLYEFKDSMRIYCSYTYSKCIVEVYCCPHAECSTDSQCENWEGSGSECKTTSKRDPYINYEFSSYKYCTPECSGSDITCWKEENGVCNSRTYNCGYETYPNCPTSYPYTSKSQCEGNIPTPISCETMSGTSGRCDSNAITDKKCIGNFVYVCSDYGSSGKCWTNMADCSLSGKTCSNGVCLTNGGAPTQKGDIRLNGEIKLSSILTRLDEPVKFTIPLKNFGTKEETINLEAGFYSSDYAKNVAQLYSLFPFFSSIPEPNCNPTEEFVKTKQIILKPGETENVEIEVTPSYALATYNIGEHNLETKPLVWFAGLYKECLGGYVNEAGTTGKGVMFDYGTRDTDCTFLKFALKPVNVWCGTSIVGICQGTQLTITDKCGIPLTFDVISGNYTDIGVAFSDVKKLSLTKEEISGATSTQLLASACRESSECLVADNYTASCISIDSLRQDGTLSETTKTSFFDKAKIVTQVGVIGGTAGAIAGLGACILGVGAGSLTIIASGGTAAPLAIPMGIIPCTTLIAGGAAIGAVGSGGITTIILNLRQDDKLVKALSARNSAEVGICTAVEKSAIGDFFKQLAFFSITGDKKTDGAIILVGGVVLIFFLLSMLGGKK